MDNIARLKNEIEQVRAFAKQDAAHISDASRKRSAEFFAQSSQEHLKDLEKQLYLLQAQRAREVVELHLVGNRVEHGAIPLGLLARLAGPLNRLIASAAFWIHHAEDPKHGIPEEWQRSLDLRLAGIGAGSSRLFISGNVAPDLTGDSPLQNALDAVFDLLSSANEEFVERVHSLGAFASRALLEFLKESERDGIGINARWITPAGQERNWDGRPHEITRIRSLLEQAGEVRESDEELEGTVSLLATTGRIELSTVGTNRGKIKVSYNRGDPNVVSKLSLHDRVRLTVRRSIFFDPVRQRDVVSYSLLNIKGGGQVRGQLNS